MTDYDLVGVGAGPSNLSLAALASPHRNLRTHFFERQETLRWHSGLLFDDSALQVSFLKDLVTIVDPTSPYSFLNFLSVSGRLHRFAAAPGNAVSRKEFEQYYQWAASRLKNVSLNCEIREIRFDGSAFRVRFDDGERSARHLSIAVGLRPFVPLFVEPFIGPTLFHSSDLKWNLHRTKRKAVVVIGGGQSGAEVVANLLDASAEITSLAWITRRSGFPQLDESAFTNEWFQPDYVRYFHGLPSGRRHALLEVQKYSSDGVSRGLLERIYRRLYELDFLSDHKLRYAILPGRELLGLSRDAGPTWRLDLRHLDSEKRECVRGDLVILATGYEYRFPDYLHQVLGDSGPIASASGLPLNSDYSVPWDGPKSNKIFVLNAGRLSHGIADPNLSLASWRAAEVLRSLQVLPQDNSRECSALTWAYRSPSSLDQRERQEGMPMSNLFIPSNPTPNGNLHLGHVAGPFVGADILRRAAIGRGEEAATLLGTAWQNTHVLIAAQRLNRDYLEVAAEYARKIEESFADVDIEYDVMLRHADIPDIERATQDAFRQLMADGAISIKDAHANYCTNDGCDDWRFQGFVTGRCPHCDSSDAYGIDCEVCARYHDDSELGEPTCAICGNSTELRALPRAFLELERMRHWFEEYFGAAELGEGVRRFVETVLKSRLPAVAITSLTSVGPDVHHPALPGQRLYPSFELAPRFKVMYDRYSSTRTLHAAPKATMLFGVDNAFERAFLFPAVLRAFEKSHVPQPTILQMTYFYLLDGKKFSTSRGHTVGVREATERFDADCVRLYVAATRPEERPTNFSRDDLQSSAEVETVKALQVAATTRSWGHVRVNQRTTSSGNLHRAVEAASSHLRDSLRPESLSCRKAAEAVLALANLTMEAFAADGADGLERDDETSVRHASASRALAALVNGAEPIIPNTARHLREAFAVPRSGF